MIQSIDEWVLKAACRQMASWKQQGLGDIRVAVNLSPAQLLRNNLYEIVERILQETGCKGEWLALEVTESCFMGNPEQARVLLHQFADLGIELVMDDFGTGYSSLSNLRQLPISKLKIDLSFIKNVPDNPDDVAIAKAVIGLANSLGMTVIAEGVESEAQQQFLLNEGCVLAQGYLYGRPMSVRQVASRLVFD